ncbi:hypothetical protein H9I19_000609 [Salmonella enterica subsp. enterica serovar Havana]|nr:hypothetical protein [Salmonella enterica subsp. enterica serovar Havana]
MQAQIRRPCTVFPAPAGINRHIEMLEDAADRVPRASGDKPEFGGTMKGSMLCSPRQRG